MSIIGLFIIVITIATQLASIRAVRIRRAELSRERPAISARLADENTRLDRTDCQLFSDEAATADAFRFAPELFEDRTRVMEELVAEGFAWFSHYSSVDCLHDVHGI